MDRNSRTSSTVRAPSTETSSDSRHCSTVTVCLKAIETGEKQFLGIYVHPEIGEVPIYVEAMMPLKDVGA